MKTNKQTIYPRTADRQLNAGDLRPDLKVVQAAFASELEKEVEFYKWHYLHEKNKYDVISKSYNQARQILFSMSQALAGLFKWVMTKAEFFEGPSPDDDMQEMITKSLSDYKEFKNSRAVTCQTCEHRGQSPISGSDCESCTDFSNYKMKVG